MDKFLGVGLLNALGLAFFIILIIVGGKVVLAKYQVPGLTDVFHAV